MVTGLIFKKKINELEDSCEERIQNEIEEAKAGIEESFRERLERVDYELSEEDDEEDAELDQEKLVKLTNKILDNAEKAKNKPNLISQVNRINEREHYTNYSGRPNEPVKNEEIDDDDIAPLDSENNEIEIIAPEEYGEMRDYDQTELYFLRDEVLVDDEGRPVENIRATIGPDALEEFGTFEADAVYVRNHQQQVDYAIFLREDMTSSNFSL